MEPVSRRGRSGGLSRGVAGRSVELVKRSTPASMHPALRYYRFRARAFRTALRDHFSHSAGDGPPLPPPLLRYRVHGSLDARGYLRVGERCSGDLRQALRLEGRELSSFRRVLDFGCGSARVLRHLGDLPASCRLYGTDIDAEAIRWCREAIPFATFEINDSSPPLPFADSTFDLIYAVSVFTHLDEELQNAWLAELRRVTAPHALLLLTTHGAYAQASLPADCHRLLAETGFAFHTVASGRFKLDGLPDFYQNSYHTQSYIQQHWSKFFHIRHYIERGLNDHQDLVVLEGH
jgi:SAM-dependent methyltransferase